MAKLLALYFLMVNILGLNTTFTESALFAEKMKLPKEEQQQFEQETVKINTHKKVYLNKKDGIVTYEATNGGTMVLGKVNVNKLVKETNAPVYFFTHSKEDQVYEIVTKEAKDTKFHEEQIGVTNLSRLYTWHVTPAIIFPSGESVQEQVEDKMLFAIINTETKHVVQKLEQKL